MVWESTSEHGSNTEDSSEGETEDEIDEDLEAYLYSLVHHEIDLQSYSLAGAKLPFENFSQIQPNYGDHEVSVEVLGGEQHDNDSNSLCCRSKEAKRKCKEADAQIRIDVPTDSFVESNTASPGNLLSSDVRMSPPSKNGAIVSKTISETQALVPKKKGLHSEKNTTGNISASREAKISTDRSSADYEAEQSFADTRQKNQQKNIAVQRNVGGRTSSCKTGRKNISEVTAGGPSGSRISDSEKWTGLEELAPWIKQNQNSKKAELGKNGTPVKKATTEVVVIASDSSDSESLHCSSNAPAHSGQKNKHSKQTLSDTNVILVSDSSSSDDSSTSFDSSESVVSDVDYKPRLDLNWNVSSADQEFIQIVKENQEQETEKQVDQLKWKINEADEFKAGKTTRYYSKLTVRCQNCSKMGHLSKECPRPKKEPSCGLCGVAGHAIHRCPNRLCFNCNQPGHVSQTCPCPRQDPRAVCLRCQRKGHTKNVCPERWRQYHITNPERASLSIPQTKRNTRVYCSNCASRGHFVFECIQERLDRYSYASYPFVSKYDLEDASRLLKHRGSHRKMKLAVTGETGCKGDNEKVHTHKGFPLQPDLESAHADAYSTRGHHPHQNKPGGPRAMNSKLTQGSIASRSTDKPKGNYRPKIKRVWRDTSDTKAFDCGNAPSPKKKKQNGIHAVTYGQQQQSSQPRVTVPKQKGKKEWVKAFRLKKQGGDCAVKGTKGQTDSHSCQQANRLVTKSHNGFRISVANQRLSQRYRNDI